MISAVDPRLLSYVTCNATSEVTPSPPSPPNSPNFRGGAKRGRNPGEAEGAKPSQFETRLPKRELMPAGATRSAWDCRWGFLARTCVPLKTLLAIRKLRPWMGPLADMLHHTCPRAMYWYDCKTPARGSGLHPGVLEFPLKRQLIE